MSWYRVKVPGCLGGVRLRGSLVTGLIVKELLVVFVDNLTKNLVGVNMVKGLDPGTFRDLVSHMIQERAAIQNVYEVVGAVEFEYTFWAKPDNESAVRQNLIDVSTRTYFALSNLGLDYLI